MSWTKTASKVAKNYTKSGGSVNSSGSWVGALTKAAGSVAKNYSSSKSSSGWGGFFGGLINGFLGGGSSGSGGSTNWGALLGAGVNAAAGAMLDEKTARELGEQQRKNIAEQGKENRRLSAFEAELLDYYKQKDKARKRVALDTYGAFSLTNRWAPGLGNPPPVDVPNKPNAG